MPFLTDGYQTTVSASIAGFTAILKEREVQPPGMDLGGPIDTATMRSIGYRTKNPASLKNIDDITMQCQYDPAAYATIVTTFMGVITTWTITFPDGSAVNVQAWLESFKPVSHKEKEFPLAEVKLCLTPNLNASGAAVQPTYVNPFGVATTMLSARDLAAAARP